MSRLINTNFSVLMLCTQFSPIVGGYEKAAERLSAELIKKGHSVTVVTERRDLNWPVEEILNGIFLKRIRIIYKPIWHSVSSLISLLFFLLLRGRKYDVWHAHQQGNWASVAIIVGKILNRPVILKLTNSGEMSIDTQLTDNLSRYIHRKVDGCIAISEETKADAEKFGIIPKRIHVIPNGFYLNPLKNDNGGISKHLHRTKLNLSSELLVLNVSGLRTQKNHQLLIEAWSLLPSDLLRKAKLAIVGDGPNLIKLNELVNKKKLQDAVLFTGMLEDVFPWYLAANIYVLSSNHEGLSNSMIEALSYGLPVVTTKVSGSGYISKNNCGIVVEKNNPIQLANALSQLISSKEYRIEYSTNALNVYENNFRIEKVAEQVIELYKKVTL